MRIESILDSPREVDLSTLSSRELIDYYRKRKLRAESELHRVKDIEAQVRWGVPI